MRKVSLGTQDRVIVTMTLVQLAIAFVLFAGVARADYEICSREDIKWPLSYYDNYMCYSTENCRDGFTCCLSDLFNHPVCIRTEKSDYQGCPPLNFDCFLPTVDEYLKYTCINNNDCDGKQICCPDFCQKSSVCVDSHHYTNNQAMAPKNMDSDVEKQGKEYAQQYFNNYYINNNFYGARNTCPTVSAVNCDLTRFSYEQFSCNDDLDCSDGDICCQYTCAESKVCLKVDFEPTRNRVYSISQNIVVDENNADSFDDFSGSDDDFSFDLDDLLGSAMAPKTYPDYYDDEDMF